MISLVSFTSTSRIAERKGHELFATMISATVQSHYPLCHVGKGKQQFVTQPLQIVVELGRLSLTQRVCRLCLVLPLPWRPSCPLLARAAEGALSFPRGGKWFQLMLMFPALLLLRPPLSLPVAAIARPASGVGHSFFC